MASVVKVLSVGLGDLVSARNGALRVVGFDVVAAISLQDAARQCASTHFDVAIVGHAFTVPERTTIIRCIRGVFRLPVILITDGLALGTVGADSQIAWDAPIDELIRSVNRFTADKRTLKVV